MVLPQKFVGESPLNRRFNPMKPAAARFLEEVGNQAAAPPTPSRTKAEAGLGDRFGRDFWGEQSLVIDINLS